MNKIYCQTCKANRSMKPIARQKGKGIQRVWECSQCHNVHAAITHNNISMIKIARINLPEETDAKQSPKV